MGNNVTTAMGNSCPCFSKVTDGDSSQAAVAKGSGRDIDEACLAATGEMIGESKRLSQNLRLSISCINLPNMDMNTKTDGMAVLCEEIRGKWSVLGMTEVIKDSINPSWIEHFNIKYRFEEQ